MKTVLFLLISIGLCNQAFSQTKLSGIVIDHHNGQPVAGASLHLTGSNLHTVSNEDGRFEMPANPGRYYMQIRHVVYETLEFPVKIVENQPLDLGVIRLDVRSIGLAEISIMASLATERQTPVAVTNLNAQVIEQRSGNRQFPEIMNRVPGIYATALGGGTGDARLSIRGFQQENVALMLNGVPVSSVENGLVYWSNWAGLADATQSIQVQRGLGASRFAGNSVGGSVNIITKTTEARSGGSFRQTLTNYGNKRTILSLSSGLMSNGFAVQLLGSRTTGPGYADATHVDGWAYYLSVSRDFGRDHKLVFTALGSPERHGQRVYGLTHDEYLRYGNKYNPNWGMFNGKVVSVNENFYHKPQVALNHYWNISERTFLASSAYASTGFGGGRFTESFGHPPAFTIRRNNQIDWDAVYQLNSTHEDFYVSPDGDILRNYSKVILTNYLASHYWYGFLSTLNHELSENIKLTAGIHGRDFKSRLREEIDDLMGGDFWIEDYAWAVDGRSGRPMIMGRGDVIRVDNGAVVRYGSLFGQIEYTHGRGSIFLASSVSGTSYRREDRYNYVSEIKSAMITKQGFDAKAGSMFDLGAGHHVFANAGFYSKEPLYKFVFVNFSNAVAQDIRNERIAAAEAGYGYTDRNTTARLNFYTTSWMDKSLLSRENIQLTDSTMTRALVRGLNARHNGIELEFFTSLISNLDIGAVASLGDWTWQNDVVAELYNDNQIPVGITEVYAKGLKVGDAPQTQLFLTAAYRFWDGFRLAAEWVYYDRLYANFDPAGRNNPNNREQAYRIPAYSLTDVFFGYDFLISNMQAQIQISSHNVFNNEHITRGEDGITHSLDTFRGFWTFGRTFNLSFRISF